MISRVFRAKAETITMAALILGAASFLSRLIGVVRNRIFAHAFGAGDVLDVYYAAFKIPDLVYNLIIVGALSAGFIPVFMSIYVKSKREAWELTNNLLHVFALILVAAAALLFIFMPWLVPLIVPGFSEANMAQTVLLSRIMLVSPILLGLSAIISGVLQSLKCFLVYSITPILYNLGIIFGALMLVPQFGIEGLAYGVIIGAALHLLIQLPSLYHHGFQHAFILKWSDPGLKEIWRLMIPRTLAMATHQINLLVMIMMASTLAAGSITIFHFANDLQYFPVGIIGLSFALAAFPLFSETVAQHQKEKFIAELQKVIRKIVIMIIPVTILFLLLRAQIVRVVLGSGQFDWAATIATADTFALFTLSLFAQCLVPTFNRAFYAMHNTKTPLLIATIGTLVNIIAAFVLKDSLGIAGLALAFSLGATTQMILLWISLRHDIGTLHESVFLPVIYKVSLATMAMALTVQLAKTWLGGAVFIDMTRFWGIFLQGAIAGVLGLMVFSVALLALRVEEAKLAYNKIKKQLFSR